MEGYRVRNDLLHFGHQAHVLQKKGIRTGIDEFADEGKRVCQFVVVDDRVEGDVDGRTVLMGIRAQCADVLYAVACRLSRTEAGSPDIHGVCPMVDGGDAAR